MSGALIAPIVALRMNKPIIMVRKSSEKSHSSRIVEGYKAASKYVILDDLICNWTNY